MSSWLDPDLSSQKLAQMLMIRLVHSSNLSPVQDKMTIFVSTFTIKLGLSKDYSLRQDLISYYNLSSFRLGKLSQFHKGSLTKGSRS